MVGEILEHCNLSHLRRLLQNRQSSADEVAVVLLADRSASAAGNIAGVYAENGCQGAGGIVSGIIYEGKVCRSGALVLRLSVVAPPVMVRLRQGKEKWSIPGAVLEWSPNDAIEGGTLLILADGLSESLAEFLMELSGLLANRVTYLGGGMGLSDFARRRCLLSAEGTFSDAAWVIPLRWRCTLGIRHRFGRVGPQLGATSTPGSQVREINWCSAFQVYRDVVRDVCGAIITEENFNQMAPLYPLGVIRENDKELVQDPESIMEDGSIRCLGLIPESSPFYIMRGDLEAMIRAARAAGAALTAIPSGKARMGLIIDCVSRYFLLCGRFDDELAAVTEAVRREHPGPAFGFLSVGEIGSCGARWADFHNKSVVAGLLYEA